jgi:chromosome segregation ATPase
MTYKWFVLVLVALMSFACFAQTTEALSKRVVDLEKEILITKEDQSKVQLDLNSLNGKLRAAIVDLKSEINTRKDQVSKLTIDQKDLATALAKEIADRQSLQEKIEKLMSTINDKTAENLTAVNMQLENIKKDISTLKKQIADDAVARDIADKANADALLAQKDNMDKSVAAITQNINESNKIIREENTKNIEIKTKETSEKIDQLKSDYDKKMSEVKSDNDKKLNELKAEYDQKLANLLKNIDAEKQTREDEQKKNDEIQKKLKKQSNQGKTLGIMGILLAILAF